MEDELNSKMEKLRKQYEGLEDEGIEKIEEWKKRLDDLNFVKIKVHSFGIFSENEEFKEIKTEDLKYLLIPFYQAELIQKFVENREMILGHALQFYDEFYKSLEKYEYLNKDRIDFYKKLTGKEDDDIENGTSKLSLEDMSKERENKILAFKYKKSLSEKLKKIEKEKDYDNNREYWVAYVELAWLKMIENIKMIKMEIDSLKFIKNQKKTGEYEKQREKDLLESKNKKIEILQFKSPEDLKNLTNTDPNNKLLKSLNVQTTFSNPNCNDCANGLTVNTLDELMGKRLNVREQVFRPTNLPVMTLEEFAEKEKARMAEAKLQEEEAKKKQAEEDSDDEEVADMKRLKEREWDDWKDLNEKGAGNKKKGR